MVNTWTVTLGLVTSLIVVVGVPASAADGPTEAQAQPPTPAEEMQRAQTILEGLRSDQAEICQAAQRQLHLFRPRDRAALEALVEGLCEFDRLHASARENARSYLVQQGSVAVKALTAASAVEAALVRNLAVESLWRMGRAAASAGPKLVELLSHKDSDTRRLVAGALGAIGEASDASITALIRALDDRQDAKVSDAAQAALGQLGGVAPNVVPALLAVLENGDEIESVRRRVLKTLATIGSAAIEAAPKLIELVGHDDPVTRREAISTLSAIGDKSEATVTAVTGALADEDTFVRQTALSTLARIGPPAASSAPRLIELVAHDDPVTRRLAAAALAGVGDASPEGVAALTAAAADVNHEVRHVALSILKELGPTAASAAPKLVELVNHEDPITRSRAAGALGAVGAPGQAAVAALSHALVDPSRGVRDAARQALERHDRLASDGVSALRTFLEGNEEEGRVRRQALSTLAEIGPVAAPAVPELIELVRHEDPPTRRLAAAALGAVGDSSPAAVAALTGVVKDGDREIRQVAMAVLAQLGARASDAVPALLALLENPDARPDDRRSATFALRRIDKAEAERRLGPGYDAIVVTRADIATLRVGPGDWPQWGGSRLRNNVPEGTNIPSDWDIGKFDRKTGQFVEGTSRNIKWVARLGSQTYGNPVIANGHVFIGTNNGAGYLERYPPTIDLGVLLCLDEQSGRFLWQHSSEKLPQGRVHDWPLQGVCSTPLVDGDRLWFVTNRCEVLCLDTEGFLDGQNDGPFQDETVTSPNEADVIWRLDMMGELGVRPHNMSTCCVLAVDDKLLVCTSNGVDEGHINLPAPQAPSFMALERETGKVLWTDNSPGGNVLHGQWASPSYAIFDGQPQVLFPGGDGWLYSFDPAGDGQGHSKLLWKFDGNPKEGEFNVAGRSTRNHMIAFAAIYDGLVYQTVGEDPEHGEGAGHLWCIDPTKRGDVSPQLVFNASDPDTPIPPKRYQACVPEEGDFVRDNPNSAVVWHYDVAAVADFNGDGKIDRKDQFLGTFHRSLGIPAIKDDLLYVADFSGVFHCLDAKTGQVYWIYDMLAACWGSAVLVDDKVYIGDEDGDVCVFPHSPLASVALQRNAKGKPIPGINMVSMGNAVYGTPVVANNVLFIANKDHLFAIAAEAPAD